MLLLFLVLGFFSTFFSCLSHLYTIWKDPHTKTKKLSLFFSYLDNTDFRLVSANIITKNKGKVLKKKSGIKFPISHNQVAKNPSCVFWHCKMYKIKLKTTQIPHHAFTHVENKLCFLPKKHSFKLRTQEQHQIARKCLNLTWSG